MMIVTDAFIARFMSRVRKDKSGCWLWAGATDSTTGYGKNLSPITRPGRPSTEGAHRVAWMLHARREIPAGMQVLHSCDIKHCVNPDHLRLGNHRENARDAVERGQYIRHNALKTHCANGHEFTPENTFRYTSHRGRGGRERVHRECKTCNRIKSLAYYYRRQGATRT